MFKNIGKMLAKLHSARIMHGAVYPKHVLVEADGSRVWLIDFEKARRRRSRSFAATRDIARLVRHAPFMTDADLEALVSAYDSARIPGSVAAAQAAEPILNRTGDRRPAVRACSVQRFQRRDARRDRRPSLSDIGWRTGNPEEYSRETESRRRSRAAARCVRQSDQARDSIRRTIASTDVADR